MQRIVSFFKEIQLNIFGYPKNKIDFENKLTYDLYWDEKNKAGRKGLNMMQIKRADLILGLLDKRNESKNSSIADIGCGDGQILSYLNKNRSFSKMIGLDVAKEALASARNLGIQTIEAEITPVNIPEADYILFLEVLEHTTNPEILLISALKKSSVGIFFSVPNSGYFRHRLRLLLGKFPLQWRVYPGEHLRFWTLTDMKWWLTAIRISNYRVFSYGGIPFLNAVWPALFAEGTLVHIKKSL